MMKTGAFPAVCMFRPTVGSEMEHVPLSDPGAMREVLAHRYEACRDASNLYDWERAAMWFLARPYVAWKEQPRRFAAV